MVKNIEYIAYRKLKGINIEFSPNVNIIAGTNGTCKTSILHTVSNSFQTVKSTDGRLLEKKSVSILKQLNKLSNPKIETLTRGDKEFNDPAQETKGTLYTTTYNDESKLSFRKHNSSTSEKKRFAVKPQYKAGENESLPAMPTIYLGLFRLFSYGEFESDDLISNITAKLPTEYQEELAKLYKDFTTYAIDFEQIKNMGKIKNRPEFKTDISGIDSNTISAGEDNLFIILTALVSLKYYYESINSTNETESILMIDEIDASLHPEFQIKLLQLFMKYSENYKIQILMTTHSLSLIEFALEHKQFCKTIYLLDQKNSVNQMKDVDKYTINMLLKNTTRQEIQLHNKIPVMTEDDEARFFLNLLFEHYKNINEGRSIEQYFHLVNANFPSEAIVNLVNDDYLLKSTMRTINILDGDQSNKANLNKQLITLPGDKSPEEIIFNHAIKLSTMPDSSFWSNDLLINDGYTFVFFERNIKNKIDNIDDTITQLKQENKSTKGVKRDLNKKLFNEYIIFWKFILKNWIEDLDNEFEINKFYKNLRILFLKTADFHGINSNSWVIINDQ